MGRQTAGKDILPKIKEYGPSEEQIKRKDQIPKGTDRAECRRYVSVIYRAANNGKQYENLERARQIGNETKIFCTTIVTSGTD